MAYTLSQLRGAWGAGKAAAEKEMSRPPLVGKYFHSIIEGNVIEWQGKVVSEMPDDRYLIQLFSWIDGAATTQRIVSLDTMNNWRFYLTQRSWVDAGDKVKLQP